MEPRFPAPFFRELQALTLSLWLCACGPGAEPPPEITPVTEADAVRFLEQATWGPSESSIQEVQRKGFEQFLNEQFSAPMSGLGWYPVTDADADITCSPGSPDHSICRRDNYSPFLLQLKFFQNAVRGQDQLRQRVAFALSQIFVVSAKQVNEAYAMARYQQLLAQQAFGNFRDILTVITLSPAMGHYLNMANNGKPDPANGISPNENYARELLQLFSVGVFLLNPDGTLQRRAGQPIAAYDEYTIKEFSRVFTGWTYPTRPGVEPKTRNPPYFAGQMIAVDGNHDTGAKKLLADAILPAYQTPARDLNDALSSVFNHPNVGPFIGKQLIQHLVTSNPSHAYVHRVADVFNNNGHGIRGDMKAVIKAILLDSEARGDAKMDFHFGKLREPVKLITGLLRAFDGKSDGVFPRAQSALMGQDIYKAPSVFGFYPPTHPLQGTELVSPVSAIYTASTALRRANFVYELLYAKNGIAPDTSVTSATGTKVDLSPLANLGNDPEKLLDKLNLVMMHNTMSRAMRDIVIRAINAVPASDPVGRARMAVYLVATSPQYQVER